MKYLKEAIPIEQQANLLIARGLGGKRTEIISKLSNVGYYRLSGYWYPFRASNNNIVPGTTIDTVWNRYTFDRELRLLILDGIGQIETMLRASLVQYHAQEYGPFGYISNSTLPKMSDKWHGSMLTRMRIEIERSTELFVKHYRGKYQSEDGLLPLWMMTELMSFGTLLTLFRGCSGKLKKKIASKFNITDKVLESWIRSLNAARNICAHHSRIWNRELGYPPLIPHKDISWHEPVEIKNNRVFSILTIIKYFIDFIAPESTWANRFRKLLASNPEIPKHSMGISPNWLECPVWG